MRQQAWIGSATDESSWASDPSINYALDGPQPTAVGFDDRHITALPAGSKFRLREPIPVRVQGSLDEGWVASFDAVNIAISGDNVTDALESLAENIVFAMELYMSEEASLNEELKQVLATLRRHLEALDD